MGNTIIKAHNSFEYDHLMSFAIYRSKRHSAAGQQGFPRARLPGPLGHCESRTANKGNKAVHHCRPAASFTCPCRIIQIPSTTWYFGRCSLDAAVRNDSERSFLFFLKLTTLDPQSYYPNYVGSCRIRSCAPRQTCCVTF